MIFYGRRHTFEKQDKHREKTYEWLHTILKQEFCP